MGSQLAFGLQYPAGHYDNMDLQTALADGQVTVGLSAALNDKTNQAAHYVEEVIILTVAALMVLKPF